VRGVCLALGLVIGCDPPPPPGDPWDSAARALLREVEDDDYRGWTEMALEGEAPHGRWSIIYTDARIDDAAATGDALAAWPDGARVVCEGRDDPDGAAHTVQIMRRDRGGWIWAQYDGDGEPLHYGTDSACAHCHAAGDDFLRSIELP